jgi:peptidoglycan/xylan/chitin deacetylase (PgdA/CDA1 family)
LRELLKKLLVPLLASRQITAIAERLFESGIPVFVLHRLAQKDLAVAGRTSPNYLRECLDYLNENNYDFISLEQLIRALQGKETMPAKPVVFTMDDGYLDQAEIAAPIFLEYKCPLTFFVITGMLDQSIWPWDAQTSWLIESADEPSLQSSATLKKLGIDFDKYPGKRELRRSTQEALKKLDAKTIPDILHKIASETGLTIPDTAPPTYLPMDWDMARKLEDQGIRFAPHSVSHSILSRLDQTAMEWEIKQSWQTIKNELNNPLKVFCYPNGRPADFSTREIKILKNTGFLGAVSVTPDFIDQNSAKAIHQIYSLPRIALPDNMIDFIQYCSWIENAKK